MAKKPAASLTAGETGSQDETDESQPWVKAGVSRATYFRRKRKLDASEEPAPASRQPKARTFETESQAIDAARETATAGRPSSYKPEYADQARKLCECGFTDQQLADFFEVSKPTLYAWQAAHPEFLASVKLGKEAPDDRTERSLYHRANGYEWYEEHAFKCKDVEYEGGRKSRETERVEVVKVLRVAPPDTAAAIFWLKNRRKEQWRDKLNLEHEGDAQPFARVMANPADLIRELLAAHQRLGRPIDMGELVALPAPKGSHEAG